METLKLVYDQIWQDSIWDLIYIVSLLLIWFQRKKWTEGAHAFGWNILIGILLMFNPLTVRLTFDRIYSGIAEYARHLWLLFVLPVIAYASVKLILSFREQWKKRLISVILLLLFISQSPSLFFEYRVPQNRYKVSDEVIQVSDLIHRDSGVRDSGQIPVLMELEDRLYEFQESSVGGAMYYGLRQYTSDFEMHYCLKEAEEIPQEIADGSLGGADYLVLSKWEELEAAAEDAGLRKIGETFNYTVYGRNVYQVTQYAQPAPLQGTCYTITDKEGHFVIIDGGWEANAEMLLYLIADHGGHVDDWIITHPHQDHVQAFENLMMGDFDITIDHIYAIDLDYQYYESVVNDFDGGFEYYQAFLECTKDHNELTYVHTGDTFDVIGLEMKVMNAFELGNECQMVDPANNGSMAFKLSGKEQSMLFLADTKEEVADQMIDQFGEGLKSDYCQMSHHGGVGSMPDYFYQIVDPEVAFMDMQRDYTLDESSVAYQHRKCMEDLGATIYCFDENSPHSVTLR